MPIPGVKVASKNQYKFYGELNQTLYDGGNIRNQKGIQTAVSAIDENKLNVDLFAMKDRVIQLFFGLLILDEQLKQNSLLQSDITAALNETSASVK
ncbi:MAG: hypothetical protein SGJ00_01365 [bacterium]|nr:hypothetical protein [bacterium]